LPASPKGSAGEPALPGQGQDLADRYEELRRRVLSGEADGHRLGLAVLLRQGVAAWMHAWDGISAAPPRPPAPGPQPDGDVGAMVAVLVSMALACGRA
jgi:hypothetical protein